MLNIHRDTLKDRIYRYGWSIERAFTTPVKNKKLMRKGEK
jgi:hypothetical protein